MGRPRKIKPIIESDEPIEREPTAEELEKTQKEDTTFVRGNEIAVVVPVSNQEAKEFAETELEGFREFRRDAFTESDALTSDET